jgi:hypothetical protein
LRNYSARGYIRLGNPLPCALKRTPWHHPITVSSSKDFTFRAIGEATGSAAARIETSGNPAAVRSGFGHPRIVVEIAPPVRENGYPPSHAALPPRRVRCRGRALACFAGDVRSGRETSPAVVWLGSLSEARPARVGWVEEDYFHRAREEDTRRSGSVGRGACTLTGLEPTGPDRFNSAQRSWSDGPSGRVNLSRFCGIWSLGLGSLVFHGRLRPNGSSNRTFDTVELWTVARGYFPPRQGMLNGCFFPSANGSALICSPLPLSLDEKDGYEL